MGGFMDTLRGRGPAEGYNYIQHTVRTTCHEVEASHVSHRVLVTCHILMSRVTRRLNSGSSLCSLCVLSQAELKSPQINTQPRRLPSRTHIN